MVRWLCLGMVLLGPGMALAEEAVFDRVSLQAEASREVGNDRMDAVLAVQEEGSRPAQLADRVNRRMRRALDWAGKFDTVTAETGGYRTQPVYRNGTLIHWRAVQTLRLESGDFIALSELVGALQEELQVRSMGFGISDEARRDVENELIDEAIGAFKARADRVRSNLDAGGWRIVHLDIGTQRGGPRPVHTMSQVPEFDKRAAPPAVSAGESTVTVTVSGTVQLVPGSVQ